MIDVPEIDTFGSTRDRKISVREVPGFLCAVDVVSQIPLSCDAAFELLTHPDNHKVFRSILVRAPRKRTPSSTRCAMCTLTVERSLAQSAHVPSQAAPSGEAHHAPESGPCIQSLGCWPVTSRTLSLAHPAPRSPFHSICMQPASQQHPCRPRERTVQHGRRSAPRSMSCALRRCLPLPAPTPTVWLPRRGRRTGGCCVMWARIRSTK